jgi:hypothetical protein
VKKIDNLNYVFQDSILVHAGFAKIKITPKDASLTQTTSTASSDRPWSGARDDVTTSASSRCDFDDSFRSTFKDGNANTSRGESKTN